MAIIIKSKEERERIRETGRIVAAVLAELRSAVRPGITTGDLDRLAAEALQRYGAKSSSLGYHGYPGHLCTSVNDEVVHGIPGKRVLQEGDIISLDLAANYQGWHADAAITIGVGEISPELKRLLKVTEDALYRGIAAARAGNRLLDISRAIQQFVESAGFSLVRQWGGHGVGRSMHEDPQVLNYVEPGLPNPALRPGMVLAIEPMVNMGGKETRVLPDRWTVVTADHSYSAHFEHTVAITEGDAEILTL
ncbi:MAG: type I methionyl aminopeptidase [Thermogemmatispora sp.]|uniref:Methionine aminopeptidase n=1 Tax=Thermogemmatispora tikiterensis TaxID=1825093 RepID=A0A328VH91_9CHLR|nr:MULTISPECIES: type I methionyl aminopeptidase [Thermogemmatispora]MBE3566313.1 type I methionyl aminopeptidase [Thermogemmatispora sp.]MBX5457981.1 type I methionyl aminopeptidase [Thermogemmatispora sp.]RAQ97308.1 type I methionyl aminopeptidase [Thermogemmatispora tikiterensis]